MEKRDDESVTSPVQRIQVDLAARELLVLQLLARGYIAHQIAQLLDTSDDVVDTVIDGVVCQLDARDRAHAIAIANRLGLIV